MSFKSSHHYKRFYYHCFILFKLFHFFIESIGFNSFTQYLRNPVFAVSSMSVNEYDLSISLYFF